MNINELISESPVDLTNCDRELIHIPGSIQPHGLLFVLEEPQLKILQVSHNTDDFLGIPPQELLNQPLSHLLAKDAIESLEDCLLQEDLLLANSIEISINIKGEIKIFDGIIHRSNEILILELEPILPNKKSGFYKFHYWVKLAICKLQAAANIQELCQIIVKEVRKLNGFDRVMVYRFDEEGHGTVIAEDKQENLEPFLGLYYPASDIPKQARELYRDNWLRIIPDANYQSVEIIPKLNPITNSPLDLSHSVLRSVSPVHIEYLHNMGVGASMSISLIKNKELWGLIACHHQESKYVSYEIRTACEFLGQMASLELSAKADSEDAEYKIELKSVHSKLVEYMARAEDFIEGLTKYQPNLLNLANAQGAVVCFDGNYSFVGNTPNPKEIEHLVEWVRENLQTEVFYTDCLSKFYEPAVNFKDVASGLLALSISKHQKHYVLWFRPEVIQTVHWGGNPNKSVEVDSSWDVRLCPRKSFDLWKETVRLKSLPWKACEVEATLELRSAILGVVLRKADELAKLNIELARSNNELDAFAYIASHDLKEPLRGIHNYSNFLMEDYSELLDEKGVAKLKTLVRLTQRMEDLIDSLLHFSRLGRVELLMQKTDLNNIVHHILDLLSARIEESYVTIRIPQPLPSIRCDRTQIGEVFSNLIVNAIKYNDKSEKWVEIGFIEPSQPSVSSILTFYIRDNGIGIREKHFDAIFRIFKRLHTAQKYGGGTGAGLTITKKIVERHGGKIWLESTIGEGTTFYFTLPV